MNIQRTRILKLTKTKGHLALHFSDGQVSVLVVRLMSSMWRKRYEARVELHDRQYDVKYALLNQAAIRCMPVYFCSLCKPDYVIALVMGLHPRLGDESHLAVLTLDLVHMIIDMTHPKRKMPPWMSCTWNLEFAKRRRARAVLECSRASQREREYDRDYTNSALQTESTAEAA